MNPAQSLRTAPWLLTAVAIVLLSCGGDGSGPSAPDDGAPTATLEQAAPTSGPGSLTPDFPNPGFEDGPEPWISLSTDAWGKPFSVSRNQDHSGESSALLELRSEEGGSARVYGVVQEVAPEEFPELLSGYYYVDRWERGTPTQYLQFVVIVWEADNKPADLGMATNHQVRYVLAGVDSQPIQIGNARFLMVGAGEPEQGQWVYFERDIREDFQQLWGAVPEGFTKLRILFEVRWDDRQPSDDPSAADVYYDDLYIGPATTSAN